MRAAPEVAPDELLELRVRRNDAGWVVEADLLHRHPHGLVHTVEPCKLAGRRPSDGRCVEVLSLRVDTLAGLAGVVAQIVDAHLPIGSEAGT